MSIETINLDSGFHPSEVGKNKEQPVFSGWPLQKMAEFKRAVVRWPRVAFTTTRRQLPHHVVPLRLARAPVVLQMQLTSNHCNS